MTITATTKINETDGNAKTNKANHKQSGGGADSGDGGGQPDGDDPQDSEGEGSVTKDGDGSNKKRKTKRTQIRYDPDVPMSKEQLAAWRREARRVRNRESAAASRQRTRNRITELETEVDEYKSKYHAALDRLKELEQMTQAKEANRTSGGDTAPADGDKATA